MLTLYDPRGTILAQIPDQGSWVGQSITEVAPGSVLASLPSSDVVQGSGLDGQIRYFHLSQIQDDAQPYPLTVAAGIDTAAFLAEPNRFITSSLLGLGLTALLMLAIAWVSSDVVLLSSTK